MSSREEAQAEAEAAFIRCGLPEKTAKEVATNAKQREEAMAVLTEVGAQGGCSKAQGNTLIMLAPKFPKNALTHRKAFLENYVMTNKVKTDDQWKEAMKFLETLGSKELTESKTKELEEAAGIGVHMTDEQIDTLIQEAVEQNKMSIQSQRYLFGWNTEFAELKRTSLKWADGKVAKAKWSAKQLELLGPETAEDKAAKAAGKGKVKKPKAAPVANGKAPAAAGQGAELPAELGRDIFNEAAGHFANPQSNNKVHTTVTFSDGRPPMHISNTAAQLRRHLEQTGGAVVTRFPPEPNGYLHIGHAKAMFIDFGLAKERCGHCLLRFDDTNPTAEKQEYIDHIEDICSWLGWAPVKVTHSAHYFEELHQFAVQLIRDGLAYVCQQMPDEIKDSREKKQGSPWRDRPIAENLKLFEDMRRGLVDEGKMTLRLRMDPGNENYNMRDLIAYRVKFAAHPKAGDAWCIYPSYDYTHCIVDSLENVTHSLCTLEFESRRASYFWLLEVLGLFKPVVWEYSRLNLAHNVMSKRKLNKLATGGLVKGWDDPRLLTLAGLRRRGVSPQAINSFCRELSATRSDTLIGLDRLEHHIRGELDTAAPRALAVLHPLKVVLEGLTGEQQVTCRRWPPGSSTSAKGDETYQAPLSSTVYIEQTDFREDGQVKDFYGLAPGREVLLRFGCIIKCTGVKKEGGQVIELTATAREPAKGERPPKGVLNWVAEPLGKAVPRFEARLYDILFRSRNPAEIPGDADEWIQDLNPESCVTVQGALAGPGLANAKPGDRFQLERLGYFCVDPDSAPDHLVLNRTCSLKATKATVSALAK